MTNKQWEHKKTVDTYSNYLTTALKIGLFVGVVLIVILLDNSF